MMNKEKIINSISWTVFGVMMLSIVVLSCVCKAQKKKLKEQSAKVEIVDSLKHENARLGAMDAITVNCTFTINNKTIMGVNTTQANNVAKSFATMTRQEILDSLYLNNGYIR